MRTRIVKNQNELDSAINNKVNSITIKSDEGVWLKIRSYDSSKVTAHGDSPCTSEDFPILRPYKDVAVKLYTGRIHLTDIH